MRCWPVKHYQSAAMSACRVRSNDAVPSRSAGIDFVRELGPLKYAQVHVGLGHPPQHRLQSPISTVTNVICAEPNRNLTPCITPGTPIHPPPTDAFLSPDPTTFPAHACLPLHRSRPRSSPDGFPFLFPSMLPPPFYPLPTLCRSYRHGVLHSALTQGKCSYVEVTMVASHGTNVSTSLHRCETDGLEE